MMSSLLGGFGLLLPSLLSVFFIPFLVIYILNKAKPTPDETSVGAKLFFLLLTSLCFQLLLIGFSMLFISILIEMPDMTSKAAMGLITGALVTGVYPVSSYIRKVRTGSNAVERQAAGVNAMITGLVFMVSTISLCVIIFTGVFGDDSAGVQEEPIKMLLVLTLVYLIGTFAASKFFIEE